VNFLRRLSLQEKKRMTARVSMLLKSRTSLTCFRACFLLGRAKDLPAPRYSYVDLLCCLIQSPEWVCIYTYRKRKGRSLKLTTHNLRVSRLRRTEGDISPLPLYPYMVRERTTSPFYPLPL